MTQARATPERDQPSEWVSLGEAAQIIGVHPATIRNWAEQGELPYRRTPGGHRRFRRADLEQWLASNRITQPAEARVLVQSALGRARLEMGDREALARLGWYGRLSPDAREVMRRQGLRLMDALIGHLADPAASNRHETAHDIGLTYGRLLKSQGLSLSQALEGYFYFVDFLVDSVVQLAETGTARPQSTWSAMLRQITLFTRAVLVSMVLVYERE
ncbi:MAG: helix-turn-helix domain-containing protein [Anaerolineae bacterium]|nr:helix-turn-helix domain-containing protein [Anaerolineae bacterium]